jgi:hypothetical protein
MCVCSLINFKSIFKLNIIKKYIKCLHIDMIVKYGNECLWINFLLYIIYFVKTLYINVLSIEFEFQIII